MANATTVKKAAQPEGDWRQLFGEAKARKFDATGEGAAYFRDAVRGYMRQRVRTVVEGAGEVVLSVVMARTAHVSYDIDKYGTKELEALFRFAANTVLGVIGDVVLGFVGKVLGEAIGGELPAVVAPKIGWESIEGGAAYHAAPRL